MITEQENTLTLPTGFTARPVEMADIETAVSLFNAAAMVKLNREKFSLEDIRAEWQREDFNLDTATHVAVAPSGELAGYVEVWDTHAVPVAPWVWGRVHPKFEGLGVGSYLLAWAEERARQVIPRVPARAQVVMRCGALSTHEPSNDLLLGYGMTATRYFWTMRVDLDEEPETAVLPPNIRIISLPDPADLRPAMRATVDAFQDHWGFVAAPEEQELHQWQQWTGTDSLWDPALWFLAMDGDEVAGVSLCRIDAYEDPAMGWVNTLGVRRPWRRSGLGLALLRHSFGELYRRGKRAVGLGVDANSLTGATRLYEKAGMRVIHQMNNYEKVLRPGADLRLQNLDG